MRLLIASSVTIIGWFVGLVAGAFAAAPQAQWTGLIVGAIGGAALALRTYPASRTSTHRDRALERIAKHRQPQ